MAERMLQFVRLSQAQPEKRDVAARRSDFGEIYREFAAERGGRAGQPLQPVRRALLLRCIAR